MSGRLRRDPLLQLFESLEPPFPSCQFRDSAQLHDSLLCQATMLRSSPGSQGLVDVFGHISDLERAHGEFLLRLSS